MGGGGARTRSAASGSGSASADPFQVGFAISVWQNSGDQHKEASNWGIFERQHTLLFQPTIHNGDRCGVSCDFWERYEEDLERARALGSNCFRLSLEWHRIEPVRGQVDMAAVQRYNEIFDCMESKGLEPHVTLHHFVHPAWFEKLGGFTKEANIAPFLDYVQTAFRLFGRRARYWATFNEPGVTSFAGHVYGSFPPGRVGHVAGCARQKLNMLRAHARAYDAIKAMPGGARAQVGIVWNYFWFEPKRSAWTPFYVRWISRLLTRMWGNDVFMRYMETGEYEWDPLPWVFSRVHYKEPGGRPGCDFLGLNYYSRGVMDWKLSPCCNAGEVMTDMPYALYPEGLVLAVHHMSALGVPIYITETGVADVGDERRPAMIQSYMEQARAFGGVGWGGVGWAGVRAGAGAAASGPRCRPSGGTRPQVERAVALGYDLRGVMYWTLVDNFEWGFGFSMRFGVYKWEDDGTQRREERASVAVLKRWYERLPARVAELLRERREKGLAAPAAAPA